MSATSAPPPASPPSQEQIRDGIDRARIHRFSLLVAVAWGLFTLNHAVAGRVVMAWLHGAACVVSSIGVAIAYSRISWRERVSLPIVAGGSLVALVAIATLTGGSDAPAMGFVSLVPLVTGLFRQRTERLVWLAISLVGIASIPVLHAFTPIDLAEPVTLAHRIVAALGLAVLLYLWGSEWRASSDAQVELLDARARTIEAQADEIKKARDEALRASELKSRFVAMTSHDLRGPLNGILGMSHALADTRLEEHQKELVRALSTSAESLSRLLADLLDVARIEAGRVDVVLAPTEIRDVLADVVDAFAPQAAEKGLDLAALASQDVPPLVQADAGRLAQVLRNLVSNAVKFTDEGTVVLEAKRDVGNLVLAVTDTGKGMPPEAVARIFAPFEQVSAHLVDRRAGTGLGLWIARNFVERWGGTIEVESKVGEGSTFRVRMPLVTVPGSLERASTPPASLVVVATRRPLTARAFGSVAREMGLHVEIAERPGFDVDDARAVVADAESLSAEELDSILSMGLGDRLVLGARATRIAECEKLAARSNARVMLLPVRASRLASALERRSGAEAPLGGTLLVVDDDAINRRVARHAAEANGLDVIEAVTGEEALEVVTRAKVDVVLLDLHLEGVTGDVTARRIRAALGEAAPALIAYTGTVMESDRRRLKEAGMEEILAKPLDRSAFTAAVSRALHARRRTRRASLRPTGTPAFEAEAVGELEKIMGGAEAARALVAESLPELATRVGAIATATEAGDVARVGLEAHRLASMAGTFGARKMATLARGIEAASREDDVPRIRSLGTELSAAHVETEPLLRAYAST